MVDAHDSTVNETGVNYAIYAYSWSAEVIELLKTSKLEMLSYIFLVTSLRKGGSTANACTIT